MPEITQVIKKKCGGSDVQITFIVVPKYAEDLGVDVLAKQEETQTQSVVSSAVVPMQAGTSTDTVGSAPQGCGTSNPFLDQLFLRSACRNRLFALIICIDKVRLLSSLFRVKI